jgi:hypothetical protein
MSQTPLGTATPYCSAAVLFQFHDAQQVAQLLRDGDGPQPTRARILDPESTEGLILATLLLAASGELESACLIGNRYSPTDLAALTGSGLGRLQKIVADLTFWALMQRRQPGSADPKTCPGALQGLTELDRLRNGERIFGFQDSAAAGLPTVTDPDTTKQANPLVSNANPFFGTHRSGPTRRRPG